MNELFRMRIAAKRQMTVPQRLLDVLSLAEGDELQVEVANGQIVATRAYKAVPIALLSPTLLSEIVREEQRMAQGRKLSLDQALEQIALGEQHAAARRQPAAALAEADQEFRGLAGRWQDSAAPPRGRILRANAARRAKTEPGKQASKGQGRQVKTELETRIVEKLGE
jgi:antitoxin component of MazEF toxin-antitoxin module